MKKILFFSFVVLLIMGCSANKEKLTDDTPINKEGVKKGEFDTTLKDIKLFNFISEEGISEEDKEKVRKAYEDVYTLWYTLPEDFVSPTHLDKLDNDEFLLNTIFYNFNIDDSNTIMTQAHTGTYKLGDGKKITAPFSYMTSKDLQVTAKKLFDKSIDTSIDSIQKVYIKELDGYIGTLNGIGGASPWYPSEPKDITIKKYKNMYVAIAKYDETIAKQGVDKIDNPIKSTIYLVFEKIEEGGESRFVYRWYYTKVNE